jgi:hypothetical protein
MAGYWSRSSTRSPALAVGRLRSEQPRILSARSISSGQIGALSTRVYGVLRAWPVAYSTNKRPVSDHGTGCGKIGARGAHWSSRACPMIGPSRCSAPCNLRHGRHPAPLMGRPCLNSDVATIGDASSGSPALIPPAVVHQLPA